MIVTKDKNIRRSPIEVEALRNAKARDVCLNRGHLDDLE
ncbi:MAG TPA: hypothetical protein VFH73_04850 [Polyangia bacterium]|nr:hypothetical protein [Polyangia bacterium]